VSSAGSAFAIVSIESSAASASAVRPVAEKAIPRVNCASATANRRSDLGRGSASTSSQRPKVWSSSWWNTTVGCTNDTCAAISSGVRSETMRAASIAFSLRPASCAANAMKW
jgi:hypothetical protein